MNWAVNWSWAIGARRLELEIEARDRSWSYSKSWS